MLTSDDGVYLRLTVGTGKRILHPARIVRVDHGLFTASFEDPDIRPQPGQDATLYFSDHQGSFFQQPVRIDAVMHGEESPTIGFVAMGEPVSAETRQSYRVSTALAGVTADVGPVRGGLALDVSATGLSVVCNASVALGSRVPVTLRFEGATHTGEAVVQSIEPVGEGRVRIGLHHAAAGVAGMSLRRGLELVTSGVQRRQLCRRASA